MTPGPDELRVRPHGQLPPQASCVSVHEAYRTVYRFFYRRVADKDTAQDLTQNTFLHFFSWQEGDRSRMPDNLEAFLLRQAEWVRRDHFREAAKTGETQMLSGGLADLAALEDGRLIALAAPGLSSIVPARVDLARAVAALPELKRFALMLRYFDGVQTSRIAEVLHRCPRRINQLVREALDELARSESLGGYDTGEEGHQ